MSQSKIAIVGAGPIGLVNAIFLTKKDFGYKVQVYESRADMQNNCPCKGRSINITLSERGLDVLREIGLDIMVKEHSVKVHSRMIHSLSGEVATQPYGKDGQGLYSINRSKLNELLLTECKQNENITIHFNHRVSGVDLSKRELTFCNGSKVQAEFIFGCDGANSVVREQMKLEGALDYQQEEIEHQYKELSMPSSALGEFMLPPNYLHLWPRDQFVLLGLPNKDHTFTLSLFMPKQQFDLITDETVLIDFFEKHFPDVLHNIGRERLIADFFGHPTGRLTSIKCSSYFSASGTLILGDAAHTIVPFYGQGTNAGFEDCLLFSQFLRDAQNDLGRAAVHFSNERLQDMHAIADMSLTHYNVLRQKVKSPWYNLHRHMESVLNFLMPGTFTPQYTMVAFSSIPYHTAMEKSRWQTKFINLVIFCLLAMLIIVVYVFILLCIILYYK